jgi:hypothetical protein
LKNENIKINYCRNYTFATSTAQKHKFQIKCKLEPPSGVQLGYSSVDVFYRYKAYIRAQFIYFGGGRWIRSRNLPNQYRNYNLYNGYKVVLNDYRGSRPYSNFKSHKVKYYKGNLGSNEVIIPRHTKVMGIMRMVMKWT